MCWCHLVVVDANAVFLTLSLHSDCCSLESKCIEHLLLKNKKVWICLCGVRGKCTFLVSLSLFCCMFCSERRMECREGLPRSAAVPVRAAESGKKQPLGGDHQLFTDRKTDAAGSGGTFCLRFLHFTFLYKFIQCAVGTLLNYVIYFSPEKISWVRV